jgi:hypothetical protein
MPLFFRQSLSFTLILALLLSQSGCTRGKALVKSYWTNASALDSSFDPSVEVAPAPTQGSSLAVKLSITRKPATAGVPLSEASNVRDIARIALVDAANKTVPAQFRVLSRWRGLPTDTARPIKWLLVDTDAPAGEYQLTLGANPTPTVKVTPAAQTANGFTVQAGRVQLSAANKGENLVSSIIVDGTERLLQPITVSIEQPRATVIVKEMAAAGNTIKVADTGALAVGSTIKFEHLGELPFPSEAGANRVTARDKDQMFTPLRNYRIDEGTPRQEDFFATKRDDSGWLYTRTPLRFAHPERTRIRDLASEEDSAVVKSVREQLVTLDHPLKLKHVGSEKVTSNAAPVILSAVIDEAKVEESGNLRTVIRQDGHFQSSDRGVSAGAMLRFTMRYFIYASQPYIRTQLRVINTGPFGFGGERNDLAPYAQHALLNALTVNLPVAGATRQRIETPNENGVKIATMAFGKSFEITAPEFAENFPKALSAENNLAKYEILPRGLGELNGQFVFEGSRAKSTDFYLGLETKNAAAMTNSIGISLEPEYVATTQAVRPLMVEKRNWTKVFPEDRALSTAAMRTERWLSGAYATESNEGVGPRPAQSLFDVRHLSREGNAEKDNGHFGWRNFGDFTWADGFTNLHYDINFILLREYLRSGDKRAFQLGSETSRYRADWGQHHGVDYWDTTRTYNFKGFSFYEKGDHGTYRIPAPSHSWIEGMWLYWAITGDESVHDSVKEASESVLNHPFANYVDGMNWNESRWLGWPALNLVVSWRYTGDVKNLEYSKKLIYAMMQAEENQGRKGYYIPPNNSFGNQIQPFMWSGYAQLGTIEYCRETNDQRVKDFLVRVADWVAGTKGGRPVLLDGKMMPDGKYAPMGTAFWWAPDKEMPDKRLTELGIMSLPVLTYAARITGRADLRDKARLLFRDIAYFRDSPDGSTLQTSELSLVNFRSPQYSGSYIKVYGHFGLFVPDYLADLATGKK